MYYGRRDSLRSNPPFQEETRRVSEGQFRHKTRSTLLYGTDKEYRKSRLALNEGRINDVFRYDHEDSEEYLTANEDSNSASISSSKRKDNGYESDKDSDLVSFYSGDEGDSSRIWTRPPVVPPSMRKPQTGRNSRTPQRRAKSSTRGAQTDIGNLRSFDQRNRAKTSSVEDLRCPMTSRDKIDQILSHLERGKSVNYLPAIDQRNIRSRPVYNISQRPRTFDFSYDYDYNY